jgi:hypothetical protein
MTLSEKVGAMVLDLLEPSNYELVSVSYKATHKDHTKPRYSKDDYTDGFRTESGLAKKLQSFERQGILLMVGKRVGNTQYVMVNPSRLDPNEWDFKIDKEFQQYFEE